MRRMTKSPKDPLERKTVAMPRSMWRDVAKFQGTEKISTEVEALRRLVMAGLRAVKREAGNGD
jgi:hypothetical protein